MGFLCVYDVILPSVVTHAIVNREERSPKKTAFIANTSVL